MSDKILKLEQAQTLYQDLRERIDALPTDSDIPEVPVQDVQVNGVSILNNSIANIEEGAWPKRGFVTIYPGYGITMRQGGTYNGMIQLDVVDDSVVKNSTKYAALRPSQINLISFYGLAKAAGDNTQIVSTNAVGTYTDEAKEAIQQMLDVPSTADLATKLDVAEAGLKVVRLI